MTTTTRSKSLVIKGARANNLKSLDVEIPLGLFICATGASGSGNAVLVIEHHVDVIKTADYVIDVGPDGGHNGGRLLCRAHRSR